MDLNPMQDISQFFNLDNKYRIYMFIKNIDHMEISIRYV